MEFPEDFKPEALAALQAVGIDTTPLSSKTVAGRLDRGDRLSMETAGGGGWGAVPRDASGDEPPESTSE